MGKAVARQCGGARDGERCGGEIGSAAEGPARDGERGLEVGDDPDRWGPPVRVGWDLFY